MKNKIFSFLKTNLVPIFIFLFTFAIYINGISPSVFGGDSGDFLSAVISHGIPHPSGYPLYTIIGILFNKLPFGSTTAWRVGLSSALFAAISVMLMYLTSLLLVKNKIIALITSLSLAFLYPYWIYAEVAEVFSLHSLFILLITYVSIKYIREKKNKYLYFLSFLCGLSLTNNLTILFIFPGLALSILLSNRTVLKKYKLLIKCFLLFILGLLPYIYIPIAASENPIVNWDRAVTLKNFVDLVLRKDYGWYDKTNSPFLVANYLRSYVVYWKEFINPLIPITFIVGVFHSIRQKKWPLFTFLMLALILFGPFYIIYGKVETKSLSNISTIERFYIPSVIYILLFSNYGIHSICTATSNVIKRKSLKKFISKMFLAAFCIIPVVSFISNYKKTNLRNVYIGDNLAFDILKPLAADSYLFVDNDEYAFNTLYVQLEKQYRTDINIPGRNTGFYKFIQDSGINLSKDDYQYLTDMRNTIELGSIFAGISNLIDKGKNVYTTSPKAFIDNERGKYVTIPYGLVYRFVKVGNSLPSKEEFLKNQQDIRDKFHLSSFVSDEEVVKYNFTLSNILKYYALDYQKTAVFIKYYYKDDELYKQYQNYFMSLDPIFSSYIK